MPEDLIAELKKKSLPDPAGGTEVRYLSLEAAEELSNRFNSSTRRINLLALQNNVVPKRYARNIGTIGVEGQARLLNSSVLVVGAGGLGGRAAELLARMGLGRVSLVDPDLFEASNLNRQNFSSETTLGKPKAEVIRDKLMEINSDVKAYALRAEGGRENLVELAEAADLVIDALDSIDDRLELQAICRETGRIMVHGAIAGDYLQVTTVYPGDPGLTSFMSSSGTGAKSRGIETETGNPATTPAVAAAIQVHEAVAILSGKGSRLRGKLLYIDLDDFTLDSILLQEFEE